MFQDFIQWTTTRAIRTTGRTPAPNTLVTKAARLRQACAMLDPHPGSCEELTRQLSDRQQVEVLLDRLYAHHAPNTVVVDLTTLREFGTYAIAKGWITSCALTASDSPKGQFQKPIEVYTVAEVNRLLLFAEVRGSIRHYMLLATVAETGRRISEVLGLRWDDLRLHETPPHLSLPTSKNGKQQLHVWCYDCGDLLAAHGCAGCGVHLCGYPEYPTFQDTNAEHRCDECNADANDNTRDMAA